MAKKGIDENIDISTSIDESESKSKEKEQPAFEEAMAELDKIVSKLEAGDVPLQEALELYKRGVVLVEHCNKKLTEAEGIVNILYKDSYGELKETVFDTEK